MNFFKTLGKKILWILAGIVLLAIGALLTYLEFGGDGRDYSSSSQSVGIFLLITGTGCFFVAFQKEKEPLPKQQPPQPPKQSDENHPPPLT